MDDVVVAESLLDGVADALLGLTVTGRIVYANAAAATVVGDDVVGRTLEEVLVPPRGRGIADLVRDGELLGRGMDRFVRATVVAGGASHVLVRLAVAGRAHVDEHELRAAIGSGELRVHYQPEIGFRNGHIISVEALVRWDRPGVGLVGPDAFIPLAEAVGLVVPLGWWVLDEACRQATTWVEQHGPDAPEVRVNLSPVQLAEADVVERVQAALQSTGCPPDRLCLEITETGLVGGVARAAERLADLAAIGVHLAMDDFGTGHSSLVHLRRLPIHVLKIDRAFVTHLPTDARARAVVAAVVHLALALGMEVTAEGIETVAQLHELQRVGVDRGQGYLFGRPAPAAVVERSFGRDVLAGALAVSP